MFLVRSKNLLYLAPHTQFSQSIVVGEKLKKGPRNNSTLNSLIENE